MAERCLANWWRFSPRSKYCKDGFVVGVEIEVAADGGMCKAGLLNRDSIKAFVLYWVNFSGFIK